MTSERLPFATPQRVWEAWDDCNKYWRQLLEQKIQDVRSGIAERSSMDLMGLDPLIWCDERG